jgi:hypothetical protein
MDDAKAKWMRTVGATEATWSDAGQLLSLKLGATPIPDADDDEDDTQSSRKKLTAEAREIAARAEHRRIALGASGRPVRRVSED